MTIGTSTFGTHNAWELSKVKLMHMKMPSSTSESVHSVTKPFPHDSTGSIVGRGVDGISVGDNVVGMVVGSVVDGIRVGFNDGIRVGCCVGISVGFQLGKEVGF